MEDEQEVVAVKSTTKFVVQERFNLIINGLSSPPPKIAVATPESRVLAVLVEEEFLIKSPDRRSRRLINGTDMD